MSSAIKLVKGDTHPTVTVSLKDKDVPLNVAGCTVRMYFRQSGLTVSAATMPGVLLTGAQNADLTIDESYTTPGSGGRVRFQLVSAAVSSPAGMYEGEIEIVFPDGSVQTVYRTVKFLLRDDF